MPKRRGSGVALLCALAVVSGCVMPNAQRASKLDVWEQKDIAEQAYIYAFPMIANYKAMYQFSVDRSSSQYKAPFNQIWNASELSTPKDTAVVTPNADTPYSILNMDLRAEPVVLCVPRIEHGRYYSVQLIDMYTFNYGYIGSRTTENGAGCYMVAGPGWKGETPAGIDKVFRCETDFSLAIYRTQVFNPADMKHVREIQEEYKVYPLSKLPQQWHSSPRSTPVDFPAFTPAAFRTQFIKYLNFLLQYAPAVPEEKELRAHFAEIGIGPGKSYDYKSLPLEDRLAVGLGVRDGYERIKQKRATLGTEVNGWRMTSVFGDRAFYNGNWLERAAAAMAGLYGNDREEAMYPMAYTDSRGMTLEGGKYRYTLTFPNGQLPPVNAFWSVTMYDAKTQLLVTNPINRYVINSSMLPNLQKNRDGSLTLYLQYVSPGKDKVSNWLPTPNREFYVVMRLYWPRPAALDGKWEPPPIIRAS